MRSCKLLMLGMLGLGFAGVAQAADVLETMRADPNLTTFIGLVDKSGVASQFAGPQTITVLAPTNGAFDMVGPSQMRGLDGNQERLRAFVLGHVLPGERTAIFGTEHTTATAKTLAGSTIEVEATGMGAGTIDNHGRVVQMNIRADNGIIHKVDHPIGMR
ncbi:fasciclin domain-containing protein [Dankookia sp. GCM10030260]|uniref:fasciclin domain-containing protein n=1 Tax=Dankookia sp. GCM10030260 TaxID=3273390 RepID=UPI003606F7D7